MHGRAERSARGVTIYLLPGLNAGERRAVLRRLRQEASRGLGPPLPLREFALALGLDRIRTAARNAKAIVRLHPAVTLLPSVFAVALLALFVAASAAGPHGSLAKTQVGLADTVSAPSGEHPLAGALQLQSARITGVPVVTGVHARTNDEGIVVFRPPMPGMPSQRGTTARSRPCDRIPASCARRR